MEENRFGDFLRFYGWGFLGVWKKAKRGNEWKLKIENGKWKMQNAECRMQNLRRENHGVIFLEFIGGDFRRLDETENGGFP